MPTERVVRELELPSGAVASVTLPGFLTQEDREALANAMVSLGCEVHPDGGEWDQPPDHDDLVGWYEWAEYTAPFPDDADEEATSYCKFLAEERRVILLMPTVNPWDHEWSIIWFLVSLAIRMTCAKVIGNKVSEVGVGDEDLL